MNSVKLIKIMALNVALISGACTAASDSRGSFQSIHTVDELLALPTSKLCVDGGPSSDDIRLILLNGPLTQPMYQNDPAMARIMINEQSISIKSRIREKCSSKPNVSSRKLTKEMLKNESETCQQGAPTKDEIKTYIKESNDPDINIDKQLRTIPYEYRLIMEEGAKLKGLTLREVFIDDVATKASQGWEKACTSKSYSKNKTKNFKNDRNTRKKPINLEEEYRIADKRLNDVWKELPSETRKALLPSQRKWIKQQATCNQDTKCLIDMINKRIIELEVESKNAK
ncbi:lysozyme inhibitor LprI family protein [Enterobacter ludwigii]|uniref:lysozyme inhibitor LprI family protein n=1 Tax=Enterobacteriaceae TaxID=543 RepID=UPI0034D6EBE2